MAKRIKEPKRSRKKWYTSRKKQIAEENIMSRALSYRPAVTLHPQDIPKIIIFTGPEGSAAREIAQAMRLRIARLRTNRKLSSGDQENYVQSNDGALYQINGDTCVILTEKHSVTWIEAHELRGCNALILTDSEIQSFRRFYQRKGWGFLHPVIYVDSPFLQRWKRVRDRFGSPLNPVHWARALVILLLSSEKKSEAISYRIKA